MSTGYKSDVPSKDIVVTWKNNVIIPDIVFNINHQCYCGPYLSPEAILKLPNQVGPASINHAFREIMQICVNTSLRGHTYVRVFSRIVSGSGQFIVTADLQGQTHGRHLPFMLSTDMTKDSVCQFLISIGACTNMITTQKTECLKCKKTRIRKMPEPLSQTQNTTNPIEWSVINVFEFLSEQEDQSIRQLADLFKSQEIDGKALLLLTNEVLLNQLQVKLGPVLKLSSLINELRDGKVQLNESKKIKFNNK